MCEVDFKKRFRKDLLPSSKCHRLRFDISFSFRTVNFLKKSVNLYIQCNPRFSAKITKITSKGNNENGALKLCEVDFKKRFRKDLLPSFKCSRLWIDLSFPFRTVNFFVKWFFSDSDFFGKKVFFMKKTPFLLLNAQFYSDFQI